MECGGNTNSIDRGSWCAWVLCVHGYCVCMHTVPMHTQYPCTHSGTLHRVMAQLPEDHAPFTRLLAEGAVGCWEAGHGCVVMGGAAHVRDEPKPGVAHVDGVVAPPSSCSIPVTHPLHPAGLVPHGLPWPPPQQQHYQQQRLNYPSPT